MSHYPVLLEEVLQYVKASTGKTFADATVGSGGHSLAIVELNPRAKILGLDLDSGSLGTLQLEIDQKKLSKRIILAHSNYANITQVAAEKGFKKFSGIILDLGFSSLQLDNSERGFSFQSSGPLDMRYNVEQNFTASEIINTYQEEKLAEIFRNYGEENFSKKIARNLVVQRKILPFSNTEQVFRVVQMSLPAPVKHKAADSARRVFQALRIEVNHELDNLQKALPAMLELLEPNGRLVVISFHSLEDRIVKNFFNNAATGCVCPLDFPVCVCGKNPEVKILTKKPVTATEQEIAENPRSRSAKLRAAEKIEQK